MLDAYDRLQVQGHTLNWRTYAALLTAQARPQDDNDWSILQGSYHPGVSQSGGTHDGGGAIDVSPFNWEQRVHALRAVGFAAWHRPAIPNLWGEHIHCVLIGDREMSPEARAQIPDYYNHRDGLASHAPDNTWHPDPIPVFDFAEWRRSNTLLDSDKEWLQQRFDAVNANVNGLQDQFNVFRDNEVARDIDDAARDQANTDAVTALGNKVDRLRDRVKALEDAVAGV